MKFYWKLVWRPLHTESASNALRNNEDKFQRKQKSLKPNLVASRLHEILR